MTRLPSGEVLCILFYTLEATIPDKLNIVSHYEESLAIILKETNI